MADEFLTEAVLEATRDLDRRSTREVLEAIHAEDYAALEAVGRVLEDIEHAVEVLVLVLQGGGRWFNVGAGTSGRMGVLDAAATPRIGCRRSRRAAWKPCGAPWKGPRTARTMPAPSSAGGS
jgi:N-acetylmuramic acid 6-phosphate etherase